MNDLAPPPSRRARPVIVKSDAEVLRGASTESLSQPAGEVLEGVLWQGPALDPDMVAASSFLGWL